MRIGEGQFELIIQVIGVNRQFLKAFDLVVSVKVQVLLGVDEDAINSHFLVEDEYLAEVYSNVSYRQSFTVQKDSIDDLYYPGIFRISQHEYLDIGVLVQGLLNIVIEVGPQKESVLIEKI